MKNLFNFKDKIREIIDTESRKAVVQRDGSVKNHFTVLDTKDATVDTVNQIFNGFDKEVRYLKQDFTNIPKQADLIFIAAPTGAGKDSLVARLNERDKEKHYMELNMDRFRQYYRKLTPDLQVKDITFAEQTNELSYEIYYIIQEILLSEFPGTNIIITGTLNETDWVEETFEKYKSNEFTDYRITLASLAVPQKDSAFSILQRYVSNVDKGIIENYDGSIIYMDFVPGAARYTGLEYHDKTYALFPRNLLYFQEMFERGHLIDCMEVYRRAERKEDYKENTLVFSTDPEAETIAKARKRELEDKLTEEDVEFEQEDEAQKTAVDVVNSIRASEPQLKDDDIFELFETIVLPKNKGYFRSQKVIREIVGSLGRIIDKEDMVEEKLSLVDSKKKSKKEDKLPGE